MQHAHQKTSRPFSRKLAGIVCSLFIMLMSLSVVAETSVALSANDTTGQTIGLTFATTPQPDQWSQAHDVTVVWNAQEGMEYSYAFSTDASVLPDDSPESTFGSISFHALADGTHLFSLKKRSAGGTWGSVIQWRFLLDATAPEPFSIHEDSRYSTQTKPVLEWSATDATSGIKEYRLSVNGRLTGIVKSPLVLEDKWLKRTIVITAIDKAGNSRSSEWNPAAPERSVSMWVFIAAGMLLVGFAGSFVVIRRRA